MNNFEEGKLLLINKPLQWTSFDVIRRIRSVTRVKKVGHAGTLDPLATGLLIICTGKLTKKINEYMAKEKEYSGSFTLGATTATYDLESEPGNFQSICDISDEQIRNTAKTFVGQTMQTPPAHSAVKIGGKRAYDLARQEKEVKLEPRKILISEFDISKIELPLVNFRVVCSTGTYIRSLANDFGATLGCGAYLSSLCRTRIGEFKLENAINIGDFEKQVKDYDAGHHRNG